MSIYAFTQKMKTALKYNGFEKSSFLQLCLEEKEEIRRHKKRESQRVGYNIGYDRALLGWIRRHREEWYNSRIKKNPRATTFQFLYRFV